MINDLRYAVVFPTNGVPLNGHISFQPGSTAISGPNGVGKSFVAEMIRYGLFGSKARRGPVSDYKNLEMELSFLDYRVERGKKEQLFDPSGEVIAVGADAVNKKIVEILGFGLEVFDVVCAANQKESERLTRLPPAKRKELIDDVVGLTAQETVEKACRDEAKGLAREAEALSQALVAPVEPEKPKGYRPSTDIGHEAVQARELEARVAELRRIIASVGEAPVEPDQPRPDLEALEAHEKECVQINARAAALHSAIARIPEPSWTRKQIKTAQELAEYDARIKLLGPKPSIDLTSFELKEMLDTWDKIDVLRNVNAWVVCPRCHHEFCPSQRLPEEPEFTRKEINADLQARERWAQAGVEPKGDRIQPAELKLAITALDRADEKALMQEELDRLPELEDKSDELAEARKLDRQWDLYEAEEDRYNERLGASLEAQNELDHTPKLKKTADELYREYSDAVVYENASERYTADKARFDELAAQIAEKQERADAFLAGAKGLVEARRTLKAFLAPSLSRVSSHLIRQMTFNSKRPLSVIDIDEEMNITADGQDVSTFNGAHATMINLALRLALGQVLVSRVFPVFIGDEIDSDCDPANAQAIADALLSCKEQLRQIVVISHKQLEGFDNDVALS